MPAGISQIWSAPTPTGLLAVKEQVYDPAGFICSDLLPEAESAAYGAHTFRLDGAAVRARVARLTPKKNGLFVTAWKRSPEGPTQPFGTADLSLLVVTTREGRHFGHFAFPTEVLLRHGIIGPVAGTGKRGFRVYPPWTRPDSPQAARTAAWQLPHFLTLHQTLDRTVDPELARALYNRAW